MKNIDLMMFPKFVMHCNPFFEQDETLTITYCGRSGIRAYHILMRKFGYKSADIGPLGKGYQMSEEDYTWFILRWS